MSHRRRRPSRRPFLGTNAEHAWRELRAQQQWSKELWVAFLYTSANDVIDELALRSRRLVEQTGGKFEIVRAHTPDDLRRSFDEMAHFERLRPGNQSWIVALRSDADGVEPTGWDAAWRGLLQRLNVGRETLRDTRAGLVLVMPPALKALTRESAPDLWSIRSLVLELDDDQAPSSRPTSLAAAPSLRVPKLELTPGIVGPAATHAQRAIDAASEERWAEAVEHAERAVAESNTRSTAHADALSLLASIEVGAGDTIAANQHAKTAIEKLEHAVRDHPDQRVLFWRRLAGLNKLRGRALLDNGDIEGASAAFDEASRWAEPPSNGDTDLERLWLWTDSCIFSAQTQRLLQHLHEAAGRAEQAITSARLLVSRNHEDGYGLLARALYERGLAAESMNELQHARDAYEESLQMLDRAGQDLPGLDRAIISISIARASQGLGDGRRAKSAAESAIEHARSSLRTQPSQEHSLVLALASRCIAMEALGEHTSIPPALAELEERMAGLVSADLDPRTRALLADAATSVVRALHGIDQLHDELVKLAMRGLEHWTRVTEGGRRTLESHGGSAQLRLQILRMLVEQDQLDLAHELIDLSLRELRAAPILGSDPSPIQHLQCAFLEERADLFRRRDQWAEAHTALTQSIRIRRTLGSMQPAGDGDLELASTMLRLAETEAKMGEWARANSTLEDALSVLEEHQEPESDPSIWASLLRVECHAARSFALLELGDTDSAESQAHRASELLAVIVTDALDDAQRNDLEYVSELLLTVQGRLDDSAPQ